MQTIKNNKTLTAAIQHLENVKQSEANLLKEHFYFTVDSLNPVNIVKEKFNDTINAPGFKGMIFKNLFKVATGLATSNIVGGLTGGPIKKMIGSVLQTQVLSLVDKATDTADSTNIVDVKEKGFSFLRNTLQKMKIK